LGNAHELLMIQEIFQMVFQQLVSIYHCFGPNLYFGWSETAISGGSSESSDIAISFSDSHFL